MTWIDVRDVAEALIIAAEKELAGGERIIISCGPWKGQDLGERFLDFVSEVSSHMCRSEHSEKISSRYPIRRRDV